MRTEGRLFSLFVAAVGVAACVLPSCRTDSEGPPPLHDAPPTTPSPMVPEEPRVPVLVRPPPRSGACYDDQVPIAGGVYSLGALESPDGARWKPLPPTRVELPAFCIDRYEYPNYKGLVSLGGVGARRAAEFCSALGKRLCSEQEWEAACRGLEGRLFSYGNRREPGRCNSDIGELELHGTSQLVGAGTLADCRTPEGVYDLNGNVSEWTSSSYEGTQYADFIGPGAEEGAAWMVARGGAPWDSAYGRSCLSRHAHPQGGDRFEDDGFRCCADPAQ